jgi:uncharacterized membrane protein (DUF106 family)
MIEIQIIEEFAKPPTSTIIVTLMALLVNLISASARRVLVDINKVRRITAEVKAWREELMKAVKEKDTTKIEKLKKKEKVMNELQAKMFWENMKPSLFFMIPFLLLWYLMSATIGLDTIVAVSPIPIYLLFFTIGPELNLWWWYLISSFAFSTMIMKLFKVDLSAS